MTTQIPATTTPETPFATPSLADGVAALLARLEAESAALLALAARMERAELARQRVEAALDALLPALAGPERDAARRRIDVCRRKPVAAERRALAAPQDAALAFLAGREPPRLAVADLQEALRARGFALARTYASKLLARLENADIVAKAGHGRYRVNRAHPEIMRRRVDALDRQIDALGAWVE